MKRTAWQRSLAIAAILSAALGATTRADEPVLDRAESLRLCQDGKAAGCERLGVDTRTSKRLAKFFKGTDYERQTEARDMDGAASQVLLAHIAELDRRPSTRLHALQRLVDVDVVARIVTSDPWAAARRAADPSADAWWDVAAFAVRISVLGRLQDTTLLADVARDADAAAVRLAAQALLNDESLSRLLARSDASAGVRQAALLRVDDEALLAEAAASDTSPETARLAAFRLDLVGRQRAGVSPQHCQPADCARQAELLLGPASRERRVAEAMPYFERACDGGDARSCRRLGDFGAPDDKARRYQQACGAGDGIACQRLADSQRSAEHAARARALLERACLGGDLESCVAQSPPRSVEAQPDYQRACEIGMWVACQQLGGALIIAEPQRALRLFETACTWGDLSSCRAAGEAYVRGRDGVPADPARAAELLVRGHSDNSAPLGGTITFTGPAAPAGSLGAGAVLGLGMGYGTLGLSGSATLLIAPDVRGSYADGGRGAVFRVEAGTRGVKAGVGFGALAIMLPPAPLAVGASLRASVMALGPTTYFGAEADVAYIARLSVGVFKEQGGRGDTRVTWGVGIGF